MMQGVGCKVHFLKTFKITSILKNQVDFHFSAILKTFQNDPTSIHPYIHPVKYTPIRGSNDVGYQKDVGWRSFNHLKMKIKVKMVCLLIFVICYTFKSNNNITIKYKWRIIFTQEFILNLIDL